MKTIPDKVEEKERKIRTKEKQKQEQYITNNRLQFSQHF